MTGQYKIAWKEEKEKAKENKQRIENWWESLKKPALSAVM